MNTFVQKGHRIGYTNAGSAIASGDVVVLGTGYRRLLSVAVADISATSGVGEVEVSGVHRLTALSTDTGSVGDPVYWDTGNLRITTTKSTFPYAGVLAAAKTNGQTTADVHINFNPRRSSILYNAVAAGTALSNTTTETALDSFSIPANTLKVGDVLKIRYQGIATATNSTDTLAVKLYIGGLSGTVLLTGTATDVANNNIFAGEAHVVIRTIGASGTLVAVGTHTDVPAASGTATHGIAEITASATVDTTAAQVVAVSGTWSVANAGNSCRLDILTVEHVG